MIVTSEMHYLYMEWVSLSLLRLNNRKTETFSNVQQEIVSYKVYVQQEVVSYKVYVQQEIVSYNMYVPVQT